MTLLERRYAWLLHDMEEARRRHEANPESSCWEELEGIAREHEQRLKARGSH